ncbi:MAG: VWA domain-containing protein [Caldilineaceae bacterium]
MFYQMRSITRCRLRIKGIIKGMLHRSLSRQPRIWLAVAVLFISVLGVALAAPPAYLTERTFWEAQGAFYELWYTSDCSSGDPDCDCDSANDLDTDGDGTFDADSPNTCLAEDPDGDGVFDTIQDLNLNGVPDLVDPDWTGGNPTTGVQESLANRQKDVLGVFIGEWGMRQPNFMIDPGDLFGDFWLIDLEPGVGGAAHRDGSRIELDTEAMLRDSYYPREALTHEVWHMTQNAYDANRAAGDWSTEGQAAMVPDRTFTDLDTNGGSKYVERVKAYLGDPTHVTTLDLDNDGTPETDQATGLLGASYKAALWWTYLVEQAGSDFVGTTGEGMDFVKRVVEWAVQPFFITGQLAADLTLRERIGRSFDQVFWDFTIANYAKETDLSRLSPVDLDGRDPQSVLTYADEQEVDAPSYGSVATQKISGSDVLKGVGGVVKPVQIGISDAEAMPDYGANYYEVFLPSPTDCPLLTWEVENKDDIPLMHSFLLIENDTNGDFVDELVSLDRHQGEIFSRGIINKPIYDRFVAIVATAGEAAGYTWETRCEQPIINIVEPTGADPASVGAPSAPGRFLLWLEVMDSNTTNSIVGLDWRQDFDVTVGGQPATVLNGDYVQNQYWLLVQAPNISGAQTGDVYDVAVDLAGAAASDQVTQAVVYDVIPKDQILIIDRSDSMNQQNKLVSAKAAARLFTDATQQGDQFGVVSFSDFAIKESPLSLIPDQDDTAGVRAGAQRDIDGITASGVTSIGSGLWMGQNMLTLDGTSGSEPWMVLLSDGMENQPPLAEPLVDTLIKPKGTKVQTIALGVEDNDELMLYIALNTCGATLVDHCFHALDNDGSPAVVSSAAMPPPSLTNEMADLYRRIGETIADHQRLWQGNGTTSGVNQINITVTGEGRQGFFSFNWENASAPLNVSLSGPAGIAPITLTDGMNHTTIFVDELLPGKYTVTLNGANEWIGSLSARVVEGAEMHAFIDTTPAERNVLDPVQLQVSVSDDDGPVPGANVSATVYRFDGTQEAITLRDDGVAPHDAEPNDGVYGYQYDRVNGVEEHNITFDIVAIGPDFELYKRLTYRPVDTSRNDNDGDGLVDRWQVRYGVRNANDDPDRDGLTNLEEMNLGTNPTRADTDRGGEIDGSEVRRGRNPLAAEDDALLPIMDFHCDSEPGKAVLRFNTHPDYDQIRVFRRTPGTAFAPLGIFNAKGGELVDNSVTNGVNYIYYLQALGPSNERGAYSIQRHCQPDIDPYPPESLIAINNDAYVTNSTQVTLTIPQSYNVDNTPDITHIKISNTPDVQSAAWQPYAQDIAWTIVPDAETGWAHVYVLLRDGAGNVSRYTMVDSILYDPSASKREKRSEVYLPLITR